MGDGWNYFDCEREAKEIFSCQLGRRVCIATHVLNYCASAHTFLYLCYVCDYVGGSWTGLPCILQVHNVTFRPVLSVGVVDALVA